MRTLHTGLLFMATRYMPILGFCFHRLLIMEIRILLIVYWEMRMPQFRITHERRILFQAMIWVAPMALCRIMNYQYMLTLLIILNGLDLVRIYFLQIPLAYSCFHRLLQTLHVIGMVLL